MITPVLANLFMHYAFGKWLEREFPAVEFERYADDAVVHCVTERQAREVLAALEGRMAGAGLELHPGKTKIVYCQDGKRRRDCPETSFTFLGCTFRARKARKGDGTGSYTGFLPAVSMDALRRMSEEVRAWHIHLHDAKELEDLAAWINPIVKGWMTCYGRYFRSALGPLLRRISSYLVRWARRKYKRLRSFKKVKKWRDGLTARQPRMFAHWKLATGFQNGL